MSGPALAICPDCGEEIGTIRAITLRGKIINYPLPKTCPVCDSILDLRLRTKRRADISQWSLIGWTAIHPYSFRNILGVA